ncbi:hypothetical protein N7G274_007091 [Stereocaulon virgatum]|uniref:Uncharacterized protein n=1 Tax=Stereocaulon virgatum TaxID=373712 RepID=A0ABR4A549_9LECA
MVHSFKGHVYQRSRPNEKEHKVEIQPTYIWSRKDFERHQILALAARRLCSSARFYGLHDRITTQERVNRFGIANSGSPFDPCVLFPIPNGKALIEARRYDLMS